MSTSNPDYEAALTIAVHFDRSDWGKVEVVGPEAQRFLHNLCTNDIMRLAVGDGCEAFLTTPKARVISHYFVGHFERDGQSVFWLDTVPGQAATLLKTLDRHLISEQAELADISGAMELHTIVGPSALALVEKHLGVSLESAAPLQHRRAVVNGLSLYVRRQAILDLPGVDIFGPPGTGKLVDALGLRKADADCFETLRIEAGFPRLRVDIDEHRLVMEVGRTAQAICYTKGCFLGQEPIVMARDRGQVNRTLLGVKVTDDVPLPTGTKLLKDGTEVGETTSSARSPRFGVIALAYLRRGHQEPGLELTTSDSLKVTVSALPFA